LLYISLFLTCLGINMSKITNIVAAVVVSLTMSSVASASVITTGTLEYDNVSNVITDNVSGETYLGWDMVKDLDYAQTVAITSAGGFYSDWHIATQTEAYSFYNAASSAGLVDVTGSQSDATWVDRADGVAFGDSYTSSQDYVGFLGDESTEVGLMGTYSGYINIIDVWSTLATLDRISGVEGIGLLLVGGTGGATTAVPEPSIIALFGLGLVGIGFARRKRQS
jgi:hypothetical protein